MAIANFKSQIDTPRAAYVHVPFCKHRCGYCNFTLVAGRDDLIEDYLRAIELELQQLGEPHQVDTLFFGGGTPTHLADEPLARLLSLVRQWFPLSAGGEFSVEANPVRWNPSVLRQFGVTRVSLGGQSFDAGKLRLLERDHTPEEFAASIRTGKDHFSSTSADLIFGVPGEEIAGWQNDLQSLIELAPQHVSTYGLTFEQGTSFWTRRERGELQSLDEELERAMYACAIDTLTCAGYEHYEVSNFAQLGHRCRHNETYWAGDGYYAIGPGAARYVGGRREINHRSVTTYLNRVLGSQSPVAESEELEPEDRAREMLVFGLRRMQGVERAEFLERTDLDLDELGGDALRRFVDQGLLADDGRTVRLTREGLFVSDAIWPSFLRH